MPVIKTYHIAKRTEGPKVGNDKLSFIHSNEKVSENIFNDVLDAKIKELLGEKCAEQFDECKATVIDALENKKKPVTIIDRTFEVKIKKTKS